MIHYKFKTKPYAHQLKALEMSWNKEVFAYFMEMGTGKSKVLLDNNNNHPSVDAKNVKTAAPAVRALWGEWPLRR